MGLLNHIKMIGSAFKEGTANKSSINQREEAARIARESQFSQAPLRQGEMAQPASPLERWRNQVNMMMQSSSPQMRKQGMAMQQAFHQKATSAQGGERHGSYYQSASDMGLEPGTEDHTQMQKKLAFRKNFQEFKTGPLTMEEKQQGGLDTNSNYYHNKGGAPTLMKPDAFNDNQRKAGAALERMISSSGATAALDDSGFDPTSIRQAVSERIPIVGSAFMTDEQQIASREATDWTMAKLRFDSGGTIKDEEIELEKAIYWPTVGNTPIVLEAKRIARENAENTMRSVASGRLTKRQADVIAKESKSKLTKMLETEAAVKAIKEKYGDVDFGGK